MKLIIFIGIKSFRVSSSHGDGGRSTKTGLVVPVCGGEYTLPVIEPLDEFAVSSFTKDHPRSTATRTVEGRVNSIHGTVLGQLHGDSWVTGGLRSVAHMKITKHLPSAKRLFQNDYRFSNHLERRAILVL